MKQRHSFTNLVYHLVFSTKNREHLIVSDTDEKFLFGLLQTKAHHLDAYLLEIGGWRDHVHLLLRTRPTMALSEIYRQLKGFSSRSWNRRYPDRRFGWSDGVWAITVDPNSMDELIFYVRNQHTHHEQDSISVEWEPEE
jgi:REP element-mobilizing transposase RayT